MDRERHTRPQRTLMPKKYAGHTAREWAVMSVALFTAGVVGAVFVRVISPTPTFTADAAMSGVHTPIAAYSSPADPAPTPSRTPGLYSPSPGYSWNQAGAPSSGPSAPPGQSGQQQGPQQQSSCGQGTQQQGSGRQQQGQGQGNWQGSGQQQQGSPTGNGGSALQAPMWQGGGNRNGGGRWSGRGSGRGNRQGSYQGNGQANCQQQQGQGQRQGQGQGNGQGQGQGQGNGPQQQPTPGPSSAAPPVAEAPAQSSAPTGACGVQPSWSPSGCLHTSLDDEFNGNTLPSTWHDGWFGTGTTGPVNHLECSSYNSSNVTVSGGYLHLGAYSTVTSDPKSGGNFQFTYGSVEWRAYLPALNSNASEIANWPALWVNGPDGAGRGEYDVVEGLHGSAMSHIPTDGNAGFQDGGGPGWHTFGVSWTQGGTVTFFHDGQEVGQKSGVPNTGPMYLVMGNQCGSSTQQSGTDMLVDWVRVWS